MITIKEEWDFIRDELPPTETQPTCEDLHETCEGLHKAVLGLTSRIKHLEKQVEAYLL